MVFNQDVYGKFPTSKFVEKLIKPKFASVYASEQEIIDTSINLRVRGDMQVFNFLDPKGGEGQLAKPISTKGIIDRLLDVGFVPYIVEETGRRDGHSLLSKHFLRFRKWGELIKKKDSGDRFVEVVVHNANNGQHKLIMTGGVFEFVCSNGMVVGSKIISKVHIAHRNFNWSVFEDGLQTLIKELPLLQKRLKPMMEYIPTEEEQKMIIESGIKARFTDKINLVDAKEIAKKKGAKEIVSRIREELEKNSEAHKTLNKFYNPYSKKKPSVYINKSDLIIGNDGASLNDFYNQIKESNNAKQSKMNMWNLCNNVERNLRNNVDLKFPLYHKEDIKKAPRGVSDPLAISNIQESIFDKAHELVMA